MDQLETPASDSESAGRDDILDAINGALNKIEAAGSFGGFARLPDLKDLGLSVHGVGDIALPLQETQARQLIAQSRQAPFGKGSDTVVDTAVRNTWELDAAQFEFRRDRWPKILDGCIKFVGQALGITSPIRAEPYKMLIYEKGAMFKAHTDTEKIPGMFGTLVVCLPSPHQGGDVVLKHHGKTKTYRTSQVQPSVLCWYSDVHHEVLPVTSGYRWVLTYNLAIPPDLERPSAALLQQDTDEIRELRHALRSWLAYEQQGQPDQGSNNYVYYLMDHEYTEASISLKALKTTDLARVQRLRQMSGELEFDIFLAVLEKMEEGGVSRGYYDDDDDDDADSWHELDDIYETSICIKKLVDLNGSLLRSEVPLDDSDLKNLIPAREDPFEDVKDRKEDYEGYTGNSGPTATHFYRTSVAVLTPRHSTDGYLSEAVGQMEAQTLLRYYITTRCKDAKLRESALHTAHQLAKAAFEPKVDFWQSKKMVDSTIVFEVLKTAIELREYTLFNNVMGWVDAKAVDSRIFSLVKTAAMSGELKFGEIRESLLSLLLRSELHHRLLCVTNLRPSDEATSSEIESLVDEVVEKSVGKLEQNQTDCTLGEDDGFAMVEFIRRYKDYDYFKTRFVPLISGPISSTPFALTTVDELIAHASASEGIFQRPETLEVAKSLTKSAISAMDVSTYRTEGGLLNEQQARAPRYSYGHSRTTPTPAQRSRIISPELLSSLFDTCIRQSWDDLLMALSLKIAAQSSSIPALEFSRLWLPFLHSLLEVLTENATPVTAPRYRQLILAIIESYIDRYVGPEPSAQINWALPPVGCRCNDCHSLSVFLADSTRSTGSFQMGKKRRQHLHNVLDGARNRAPCSHQIDWSTNPETLVVTKKRRKGMERDAWEARLKTVRGELEGFADDLGSVLKEDYEKIMGMVSLERRPGGAGGAGGSAALATTAAPVGPAGQTQQLQGQSAQSVTERGTLAGLAGAMVRSGVASGSVAGVKRKAE